MVSGPPSTKLPPLAQISSYATAFGPNLYRSAFKLCLVMLTYLLISHNCVNYKIVQQTNL